MSSKRVCSLVCFFFGFGYEKLVLSRAAVVVGIEEEPANTRCWSCHVSATNSMLTWTMKNAVFLCKRRSWPRELGKVFWRRPRTGCAWGSRVKLGVQVRSRGPKTAAACCMSRFCRQWRRSTNPLAIIDLISHVSSALQYCILAFFLLAQNSCISRVLQFIFG